MNRIEMIEKLETLEPALDKKPMTPIMGHFWFTGERAMAYNETIAISVPFPTKFKGSVEGDTLLKILKSSLAKEAELIASENAITLKAAGTKLVMPKLPPENFIFTMPKTNNPTTLKPDWIFFQVLEDCLIAVGDNAMDTEQLGVTIIKDKKLKLIFSTNVSTMIYTKIADDVPLLDMPQDRIILPTSFCEQMLKWKDGKKMQLQITKQEAIFRSDDVIIFGRLLIADKPRDLKTTVEQLAPKDLPLIKIPKRFPMVIERALIIADDKNKAALQIKIENNKMICELASIRGELTESMTLDEKHDHISVVVNPTFFKKPDLFEKIAVTESCLVMTKSKTFYFVSTKGQRKAKQDE